MTAKARSAREELRLLGSAFQLLASKLADECSEVKAGESACVVHSFHGPSDVWQPAQREEPRPAQNLATDEPDVSMLMQLACIVTAHLRALGLQSSLVSAPGEALAAADGSALPDSVKSALASANVAFLLTHRLFPAEARARALKAGCRIVSACGLSTEMLLRIAMTDHRALEAATKKGGAVFDSAGQVRMRGAAGTDLRVSVRGMRPVLFTGRATRPGELTALPAGVVGVACEAGSARGTLVIDGSIKDVGIVKDPVALEIERGEVVGVKGGQEAEALRKAFESGGPNGACVCEIGFGTNPWAVQTGVLLEDERVLGYAHVGFGRNAHLGGTIRSSLHLDTTFKDPELEIEGVDGVGPTTTVNASVVTGWYPQGGAGTAG